MAAAFIAYKNKPENYFLREYIMCFSSGRFPYFLNLIISLIILLTASLPALAGYNTNNAPDCSEAYADPVNLWSPNHKLESINIAGVTDPDDDSFTIEIQCIFQDEPVNDMGDGNTQWDADGIGESSASVLSERAGKLNGRVYHIDFIATDSHGARCGGEV